MPNRPGWVGCHGVRLEGETFGFGRVTGTALATVTVACATVDAPDGLPIWSQHGEAVVRGARVAVERVMRRRADGVMVVSGSHDPFVAVDASRGFVTVGEGRVAAQRQMLAAFALPLVLHATNTLLMHAAACATDEGATLICGATGSGKSTSLARLVDQGWLAVSEDVCAIDLRDGTPRVWPGPPWVRLLEGQHGPRGGAALFDSGDKTAWNISTAQPSEPLPVTRVVVLDAPGGERPQREMMSTAEAIRAVARNAVWLEETQSKGPQLFGRITHLATNVPTVRLRIPRRERWEHALPDLLHGATLS